MASAREVNPEKQVGGTQLEVDLNRGGEEGWGMGGIKSQAEENE